MKKWSIRTEAMDPLISVVIPTYNRAAYLGRALQSVFAQTFKDFEVIVVDDGSTDNTADIVNAWKDKIHYFYQKNQGRAVARNKGIELAKGKYIAWLDSDDEWYPDRLARQVPVMEKNADTGMTLGHIDFIDQDNKKLDKLTQALSQIGITMYQALSISPCPVIIFLDFSALFII